MDLFGAALFQVTGQQLSVAATRRTIGRIETLFDGHLPSPAELLAVEPIQLRAAGLVAAEGRHAARPRRAAVGWPAGRRHLGGNAR